MFQIAGDAMLPLLASVYSSYSRWYIAFIRIDHFIKEVTILLFAVLNICGQGNRKNDGNTHDTLILTKKLISVFQTFLIFKQTSETLFITNISSIRKLLLRSCLIQENLIHSSYN